MISDRKPDFSGVSARVDSTAEQARKADFSGVSTRVDSSADVIGGHLYTVRKGDTLSAIAKQHYGQASAWRILFEANREVLEDPDRIHPGQEIRIPPRAAP
jgi:nucleoid-associated protein YgaU